MASRQKGGPDSSPSGWSGPGMLITEKPLSAWTCCHRSRTSASSIVQVHLGLSSSLGPWRSRGFFQPSGTDLRGNG